MRAKEKTKLDVLHWLCDSTYLGQESGYILLATGR